MRLLIISSSKRQKEKPPTRIPAMERYHGMAFGVIRKLRRQGKLPKDLDILIVSAKFGIIGPEEEIPYADQPMTFETAHELRKSFQDRLKAKINQVKYSEIYVNLGTTYAESIRGFEEFADARVTYASGTLGKRANQMRQWILRT